MPNKNELKKVIENNRGRKNISCIVGDAYSNMTYMTITDEIDLCFIDCVHDYSNVKEDIENIIINKRKLALKKELHETIYEEALKTKKFEVYRN